MSKVPAGPARERAMLRELEAIADKIADMPMPDRVRFLVWLGLFYAEPGERPYIMADVLGELAGEP